MTWNFMFFVNSILLGIGLAMDAFSVSLANGLAEPAMKRRRICAVAGTFAFFQALMPMIGWLCVHLFIKFFSEFQKFIPWIALLLLLYIGTSMIIGAVRKNGEDHTESKVGFWALMLQGVATSIDALSVGFTIAEYDVLMASVSALIIAAVTFIICVIGLIIGKKFGTKLSDKATIFGGIILIFIGIEIFITGVFF